MSSILDRSVVSPEHYPQFEEKKPVSLTPLLQEKVGDALQKFDITEKKAETLTGSLLLAKDLSGKNIDDIVSNFREDFGYKSDAWGEYKKCPDPECTEVLSVQDVYKLEPKEYYPLRNLEQFPRKVTCPSHPNLFMVDFWNAEELKQSFTSKYKANSETIAYTLSNDNENIVGTTIAYPCSFEEAWKNEFQDLHGDMKANYKRALEEFCAVNLDTNPEVYVWNLIAITRPYRNPKYTQQLLIELSNAIPKKYYDLPILCEIDINNPFTALLATFGTRVLTDSSLNARLKLGVLAPRVVDFIEGIRRFYAADPELIQRSSFYRAMQKEGKLQGYINSHSYSNSHSTYAAA